MINFLDQRLGRTEKNEMSGGGRAALATVSVSTFHNPSQRNERLLGNDAAPGRAHLVSQCIIVRSKHRPSIIVLTSVPLSLSRILVLSELFLQCFCIRQVD